MPMDFSIYIHKSAQSTIIGRNILNHYDGIARVVKDPHNADVLLKKWDIHDNNNIYEDPNHYKTVYVHHSLRAARMDMHKKMSMRKGMNVDQCDCYVRNPHQPRMLFSHLDLDYTKAIYVPVSFIDHVRIGQKKDYWYNNNNNNNPITYHKRAYWSGNIANHEFRDWVYKAIHNLPNILSTPQNNDVYAKHHKPDQRFYQNMISNIRQSDIFFVIRGDLPSTFTFFDTISNNTIPCEIGCRYGGMDWQSIGYNVNDILITLEPTQTLTNGNSYKKILDLMHKPKKIIHMKNTIKDFYMRFIATDRPYQQRCHYLIGLGYMDFVVAKILQFIDNNYTVADHNLFTSYIQYIKR